MTRLISIALICLMSFYASCPIAVAAEAGSYANIVNQLMYANTGQVASAEALTNFGAALSAANAPTTLSGLAAAYSSNTAVKTLIDSLGTQPAVATVSTPNFVNGIYQNVFDHTAQLEGLLFWSSAIDRGAITKGGAVLNILAGASAAEMTDFTAKITVAQTFQSQAIADEAAKLAADQAAAAKAAQDAKDAADKAAKEAQDAADKLAKETADKAAKDAEKAAKQNDGGGVVNAVKNFVHNHPVATVVITTVVVAAIVTAITVPICVHQNNVNKANNRNRALNNQAIVTRMIQLANPTPTPVSAVSTAVQAGGGYQPPI